MLVYIYCTAMPTIAVGIKFKVGIPENERHLSVVYGGSV